MSQVDSAHPEIGVFGRSPQKPSFQQENPSGQKPLSRAVADAGGRGLAGASRPGRRQTVSLDKVTLTSTRLGLAGGRFGSTCRSMRRSIRPKRAGAEHFGAVRPNIRAPAGPRHRSIAARVTRAIGRKLDCLSPNPSGETSTPAAPAPSAAPPGADRPAFAIGHLRLAGR